MGGIAWYKNVAIAPRGGDRGRDGGGGTTVATSIVSSAETTVASISTNISSGSSDTSTTHVLSFVNSAT